jgi:hypothetical protein
MKPMLNTSLLTAALIATPTMTTASQCVPGVTFTNLANYGYSLHHSPQHLGHRPYYHLRHPEMYWRHNQSAESESIYQRAEKPATRTAAAAVAVLDSASTLQCPGITTDKFDSIKVDAAASIITTDTRATNGIIHLIDAVTTPNWRHRSYPESFANMTLIERSGTYDRIIAKPAILRDTLYIQYLVDREKPYTRKF